MLAAAGKPIDLEIIGSRPGILDIFRWLRMPTATPRLEVLDGLDLVPKLTPFGIRPYE